ncbi:hypothetical protein H4Q26_005161 [Puccinia striiformis f. sp. tritici PST-130]|nr:hypothetical protein H4Q26_005161 [Puccinia striiformis f. sp. tritici PST-130]
MTILQNSLKNLQGGGKNVDRYVQYIQSRYGSLSCQLILLHYLSNSIINAQKAERDAALQRTIEATTTAG